MYENYLEIVDIVQGISLIHIYQKWGHYIIRYITKIVKMKSQIPWGALINISRLYHKPKC